MSGFLLHLMRHPVPVRPNLLLGHCDDPPLPFSVTQCVERAQPLEFAAVIASDLCRAAIPAQEIAAARDAPLTLDPRWRELDFGSWTGLAATDIDDHARFWDDPEYHAPPGGERWSQIRARVGAALDGITEPTLVLTHAGAMRAALSVLFHMEHRQTWAFSLPYNSVLSLRVWPGEDEPTAQIAGLVT